MSSTQIDSSEPVEIDSTQEQDETSQPRKKMKLRSKYWQYFEVLEEGGTRKGKCKYCSRIICADTTKIGTAGLKNHYDSCKMKSNDKKSGHTKLVFQKGVTDDSSMVGTWKFDQAASRSALAEMIIIDELPFKHVENAGFKKYMAEVQPRFRIPSRWTVARDCYDCYLRERRKLKTFLKKNCYRVCLTTDTLTSLQGINYMCLTAHFIDREWKLHKKILNFCPISSHRGDAIGKAVENCLLEWGITKVFTITVDNASSNDVAVAYLRKRMDHWGQSIMDGKILHMRCVAHIINLVVVDGLKLIGDLVDRVRGAVKYVRASPARLEKFKECVQIERIESKSLLILDVPTRWNSTFLMLDTAQKFERAFERFEFLDSHYRTELSAAEGIPSSDDWREVRRMCLFLKLFHDLTKRVSGSLYVTLNSCSHEISAVKALLHEWCASDDEGLKNMASHMTAKYDEYWGNVEKMNLLIYIGVVLDPRDKLFGLKFTLDQMFGANTQVVEDMKAWVMKMTCQLFDEYKQMVAQRSNQTNAEGSKVQDKEIDDRVQPSDWRKIMTKTRYKYMKQMMGSDSKTELDKYLSEDTEDDSEDFDILRWWRVNSIRFPVLSLMARDMLAVPISTAASESCFCTEGRVLDAFRSSLTPRIVQTLVCAQDWLRHSIDGKMSVEEDLEELIEIEKEWSKLNVEEEESSTTATAPQPALVL